MLEVNDLYVGYYKDLNILQGVSVKAEQGKITTVLGANGVGKSTLLKAIFGFLSPTAGQILLDGRNVTTIPAHQRVNLGISYIMQEASIFPWMTVDENIQLGAWSFRNDRARIRQKMEENYRRFPLLIDRKKTQAGKLSGGMQRMVEIARILMSDPRLILVDEPTAGLAVQAAREVYHLLKRLRDEYHITILLVDQDIRSALKIADTVYVLDLGRNKFSGPVSEFTDLEKAFWV